MIFQLNIILSISVLILNLFNYTDGSNISNDDYFSYNTKQTANPTSRNSSNQWGLDTDTGSANARASRGVNNSSYNYPSTKQANDAATLTESPSMRGLRGLKFGNSLSTTSNSNLDQGYNSKASLTGSDDGAKYTSQYENPQTKPQTSFYSRVSNRIDSPANQEVKGNRFPFNSNVGMIQPRVSTSPSDSYNYSPRQQNGAETLNESAQAKPLQQGLFGLKVGVPPTPAVNRNSAYPATQPLSLTGTFNQSAGVKPMQQGLTATTPSVPPTPAVNRNSAYPATQPLSLTGTFNQSAGVKPMQQGLTATTPRHTEESVFVSKIQELKELCLQMENMPRPPPPDISELFNPDRVLIAPVSNKKDLDEDTSKLIPNINVVLEMNQKMREVQPKFFSGEKMYKNGELNTNEGKNCLPISLEDNLKDNNEWKIYKCSNVLNNNQIQKLSNIRKQSFMIRTKVQNEIGKMNCDIVPSLVFDDVDFVWTPVLPTEAAPFNNMKYTQFLMHQIYWCITDTFPVYLMDKHIGLTIATAGYISEDGRSIINLNSGYFPVGILPPEYFALSILH